MDSISTSMQVQQYEEDTHFFLMAEDNPADAALFTEMLNDAFEGEYKVICVSKFADIYTSLSSGTFDALILDMNLPDQSGVDNVTLVGREFPTLPIVVLTGNEDLDLAVESLKNGAQDYLTKNNVTPAILARSLRYAKERKNIEERLKLALDTAYSANKQLEIQAKFDALTGLPNRTYFHDIATRAIKRSDRVGKSFALLYFDLNGFKKINDWLGHLDGDQLLIQVSHRIQSIVREADFLARLGGDEFVILTDVIDQRSDISALINRIEETFDTPFIVGSHELDCAVAIGVAYYPEAATLDLLIKQADYAMYEAKAKNETFTCFYTNSVEKQFARVQQIELLLSKGVAEEQIYSVYQPIININDPDTVNFEILARWNEPDLGEIYPDEFIPIAEMTPAINEITRLLVKQLEQIYNKLVEQGKVIGKVSINISPGQLGSKQFCHSFDQWVTQAGIPHDVICLEIIERQMVENFRTCKRQFNTLHEKQFRIALDDFGSGFSSFTHLTELSFDLLKIDRKLIQNIHQNPRNHALAVGIIEMAHRLNMEVVAEGIETIEEREAMQELRCDYIQGYYLSMPLTAEECLNYYLTP